MLIVYFSETPFTRLGNFPFFFFFWVVENFFVCLAFKNYLAIFTCLKGRGREGGSERQWKGEGLMVFLSINSLPKCLQYLGLCQAGSWEPNQGLLYEWLEPSPACCLPGCMLARRAGLSTQPGYEPRNSRVL